MSFGKQSAPAAPDYTGAAQATAQGNLAAAQQAQRANMVNQYTPYGSLQYTQDATSRFGSDPSYSANINLSPVGQQLLDDQNKSSLGLGAQTNQALGRVEESLSKPFNYGNVQDVSNDTYNQETARLDPQWDHRQEQIETQLVNQGLRPGTEAYDNAMRDFNVGRNDAYSRARLNAYNMAPTQFQLAQSIRSQPLNELNAIRTGSQVTNPQFSSTPQQQTTQGANLLGAAQDQYSGQLAGVNSSNANTSNFFGGLMGLGGTLGGAAIKNGGWAGLFA